MDEERREREVRKAEEDVERAVQRERDDDDSPIVSDAASEDVLRAAGRVLQPAVSRLPGPLAVLGQSALSLGLAWAQGEDTSIG